MIDLAKLKAAAESSDGDRTVVERSWLRQVLAELTEAREDGYRRGEVFGRRNAFNG